MLNAKHVSRSGSLLGRAFLQQPTVTLVGAGFSKTPCCPPNFQHDLRVADMAGLAWRTIIFGRVQMAED